MKRHETYAWLAALGVWLWAPAAAHAHRLDEYLQATRIAIDDDRVRLEIDLTAGAAVSNEVVAWIDADGDGRISDAEGHAYARDVLRSVVLSVDDRVVPIALEEVRVPHESSMSLGVGTIQVRAAAKTLAAGAGRHQVSYANTHRSERSVYLVNALAPADDRILISGQQRDRAQHSLTLEYTVSSQTPWARTYSLLAALAMAGVLGISRGRHPRPQRRAPRRWPPGTQETAE